MSKQAKNSLHRKLQPSFQEQFLDSKPTRKLQHFEHRLQLSLANFVDSTTIASRWKITNTTKIWTKIIRVSVPLFTM
jgi:hypothetical protein